MDTQKLQKKLSRKNKRTLKKERQTLLERQETISKKKDVLWEQREMLRDDYLIACKAKDEDSKKVILDQLEVIRGEITDINKEYKENSEAIDCYAKELKSRDEGSAALITAGAGLATGIGGLFLGWKSLSKAYKMDVDGDMRNKRTYEIFERINPFKFFMNKK